MLRHAEEVTGNVSATCRYYGISRPTFYKWLHRYEELRAEGIGLSQLARELAFGADDLRDLMLGLAAVSVEWVR